MTLCPYCGNEQSYPTFCCRASMHAAEIAFRHDVLNETPDPALYADQVVAHFRDVYGWTESETRRMLLEPIDAPGGPAIDAVDAMKYIFQPGKDDR